MQTLIPQNPDNALITRSLRHLIGALACSSLLLSACGGDGAGSSDGGGQNDGGACTNSCDLLGETRCTSSVIEGCAIGSDGCLSWTQGLDCQKAGQSCDDSSGIASCKEATGNCNDGLQNLGESDVDCGGPACGPCAQAKGCVLDRDCLSAFCDPSSKLCSSITESCTDSLKNQDETDTDCGGLVCGPCGDQKACLVNGDCQSGACDPAAKLCVTPGSCSDGVKNQDETGVDCGGVNCVVCALGGGCLKNSDCQSATCDVGNSNLCVSVSTPTCADGVQNQNETGVDCGGGCPACGLGVACQSHSDCLSGVCDLGGTRSCVNTDPSYQVNEDYETLDFSRFPYNFTSDLAHDWVIETTPANCHAGLACARTDPAHAANELSFYEVSLSVRQDTTISFWAKVNSEPNEHFFRFFIDGVEQVAVSGQVDWTLYSFPVQATGANGKNRVFRWAFSRSAYMDPNHPPWIEAFVDDINMPDWNTEPSTPEAIRPWNGALTVNPSPTFEWQSFDPDFDTITYELQWDQDPSFPLPFSTGEINDSQFMPQSPLSDQSIYYWRVRAKDNSDYRWSAWGGPWAVQIESAYEYDTVWRQSVDAEFNMDTVSGAVVTGNQVLSNILVDQTQTLSAGATPATGASANLVFSSLPLSGVGTPATVSVTAAGDLNSAATEYFDLFVEGTLLGRLTNTSCTATASFTIPDVSPYLSDGVVNFQIVAGGGVNHGGCIAASAEHIDIRLNYQGGRTGSVVSTPIDFSLFQGRSTWEKVQVEGTGEISLRVLDGTGTPVPDSVLPGNSGGLSTRTIHLWNLEPRDYPVIILEGTLGIGSSLDAWQVVGSDVYSFSFSHDGDDEGWVGQDFGVSPTLSTAGGVMRLDSLAAGTDPHVEYFFDQPLDAARFSTVEVRLRSGNNYNNDTVSFYWQSNFGLFDARRSFTHPDIFLQSMQDLSFDLSLTPASPGEPWQGQIEGIRIDPVDRFYDNLVQPADGWFEIDRIVIY